MACTGLYMGFRNYVDALIRRSLEKPEGMTTHILKKITMRVQEFLLRVPWIGKVVMTS
jgi:hypothetical protein